MARRAPRAVRLPAPGVPLRPLPSLAHRRRRRPRGRTLRVRRRRGAQTPPRGDVSRDLPRARQIFPPGVPRSRPDRRAPARGGRGAPSVHRAVLRPERSRRLRVVDLGERLRAARGTPAGARRTLPRLQPGRDGQEGVGGDDRPRRRHALPGRSGPPDPAVQPDVQGVRRAVVRGDPRAAVRPAPFGSRRRRGALLRTTGGMLPRADREMVRGQPLPVRGGPRRRDPGDDRHDPRLDGAEEGRRGVDPEESPAERGARRAQAQPGQGPPSGEDGVDRAARGRRGPRDQQPDRLHQQQPLHPRKISVAPLRVPRRPVRVHRRRRAAGTGRIGPAAAGHASRSTTS